MKGPQRQLPSFIAELKRRRVPRSLLVYLATGFAILEGVDILTGVVSLPPWTLQAVLILLLLGFPVALVVSWTYDLTSHGLVHTSDVGDTPESDSRPEGVRVQPSESTWLTPGTVALVVVLLLVGGLGGMVLEPLLRGGGAFGRGPALTDARASLAFLPLENLSTDEENRYFADGIHEEVLTNLSRIADLKVISRASVMGYRGQELSIRDIATELDVGTIATGSVRRADDRVRIVVHLIDAATDEELWGDTYDRTLDDVFAVQADIARSVAGALAATLSPETESRLDSAPTDDDEAYLAFLRGGETLTRAILELDPGGLEETVRSLQLAVTLDTDFAVAHAYLSVALEWRKRVAVTEAERTRYAREAREAAERALALAPNLPEGHFAIAFQGSQLPGSDVRTREDLEHLRTAVAGLPNRPAVLRELAVRLERLGMIEDAARFSMRAVELEPRSALYQLQAGDHARLLRDFEAAGRHLQLAFTLSSGALAGVTHIYRSRLLLELSRGGGVEGIRRIFQEESQIFELSPGATRARLEEFPELMVGGGYDEFVGRLSPSAPDPGLRCACYELKAWMRTLQGQEDAARFYWDSLSVELAEATGVLANERDASLNMAKGALAAARAGRADAARQILDGIPEPDANTPGGRDALYLRAATHAALEDAEAAVADLRQLLEAPTGVTIQLLNTRLGWEPIRNHPAFLGMTGG